MPKYRVKSHLTHDGVEYPPGAEVTMTEAQAALVPDAVSLIEKIEPPRHKDAKKA